MSSLHLLPIMPFLNDLALQNWFDEGTRAKIHILSHDPGATLRTLIDSPNLPKPYGGELDWKYEDAPNLDAETRAVIGEAMPKGPVIFVDGKVARPPRGNAEASK